MATARKSLVTGGAEGGGPAEHVVSASALLAGWLQKKGGGGADGEKRNWAKGGRRNWKWRWVVVTSSQFITWYESEKRNDLKGSLALHGAQVGRTPPEPSRAEAKEVVAAARGVVGSAARD